eukprot:5372581-Prymnesium_polylepis.1
MRPKIPNGEPPTRRVQIRVHVVSLRLKAAHLPHTPVLLCAHGTYLRDHSVERSMRQLSTVVSWIRWCCGPPDAESDQLFSEITPAGARGAGATATAPPLLKVKATSPRLPSHAA